MLKRQRQASPPPPPSSSSFSSSNIPFIFDSVAFDSDERLAKRRRTQPPILDGTQRGWARVVVEEEDADTDDGYDDDSEAQQAPVTTRTMTSSDEYKATNSMLRDLHTLHQHRLLFSSQSNCGSALLPTPAACSFPPTKLHPRAHLEPNPAHGARFPMQKSAANKISEEAEVVSERYENINKVLGSLFLSRRRLLASDANLA